MKKALFESGMLLRRVTPLRTVLTLVCVCCVVFMSSCAKTGGDAESTTEADNAVGTTVDPNDVLSGELGGLEIVDSYSFSGTFVEDGDNRQVENVAAVTIRNNYSKTLEYALIKEKFPDGTVYTYKATVIFPGETLCISESGAAQYRNDDSDAQWSVDSMPAYFESEPTANTDTFDYSLTDGCLTVVNKTDEAIEGTVYVYYKNYDGTSLTGGITYRAKIAGGIESGGVSQTFSDHITADGTRVVYSEIIYDSATEEP